MKIRNSRNRVMDRENQKHKRGQNGKESGKRTGFRFAHFPLFAFEVKHDRDGGGIDSRRI
jgi:hypothetical protein